MNPKMALTEFASALNVTIQFLHQQIRKKNLEYHKVHYSKKAYFYHETARILGNFSFQPQVISFQVVKGGAGKTTLCLNLGIRASLYGAKTLFIDLDCQANLTAGCGIELSDTPIMIDILNKNLDINQSIINVCPGLDIIPSRIENTLLDNLLMLKRCPLDRVYKELLSPLRARYDLILIDCPSAIGTSVAAISLASDKIIAPVVPSKFALSGIDLTRKELLSINNTFKTSITLHPIINEYDTRTYLSNETLGELIANPDYKSCLLRSVIRRNQEFANTQNKKISIYDALIPNTAKEDIDSLTREILNI